MACMTFINLTSYLNLPSKFSAFSANGKGDFFKTLSKAPNIIVFISFGPIWEKHVYRILKEI
jgi:hypothetical protein